MEALGGEPMEVIVQRVESVWRQSGLRPAAQRDIGCRRLDSPDPCSAESSLNFVYRNDF